MYIKESNNLIDYKQAISAMEQYVQKIINNGAKDKLWLLEHQDVYSCGVSGSADDLLDKNIQLVKTGRGGKITYHGKGMLIAYAMIDLKRRNMMDVRKYVLSLEQIVINFLARLGIKGFVCDGRVGIWVEHQGEEKKISAIGVRLKKWTSFHGVSINISPDLTKFDKIVPCGIKSFGITSLKELDIDISVEEAKQMLKEEFCKIY